MISLLILHIDAQPAAIAKSSSAPMIALIPSYRCRLCQIATAPHAKVRFIGHSNCRAVVVAFRPINYRPNRYGRIEERNNSYERMSGIYVV
jgi:hypothetical protein